MKARAGRWLGLLVAFSSMSLVGQIAGMLAGLIYVRYMPVAEYASYALCLTLLTFLSLATDLGLTGSLTYFWRECLRRGQAFSSVLSEVRRLRLYLLVPCGVAVLAGLPLLLSESGYGALEVTVLSALVIATGLATINAGINLQVLRLAGQLNSSYKAEIAGHITRLGVAVAVAAGLAASAFVGLVGGLLGGLVTMVMSRRFEQAMPGSGAIEPVPGVRREILGYALPVAAPVLVFALQDSLVLWTVAAKSSNTLVAEVFALGRIGALIALLGGFINVVVIPRMAGITDARRYNVASIQVRAGVIAVGVAAIIFAYLFPEPLLWIIGNNYSHLQSELVLAIAVAAITLITFTTALINRARGWVRRDPVTAAVQAVIIAGLLAVWDYSSTASVLQLSLTLAVCNALLSTAVNIAGMLSPGLVRLANATPDKGET